MLRTNDCEIECPGTCNPRVDISMAGFCDTGQPQHSRHWSHPITLVSNCLLQKPHARFPITASVDEAESSGSNRLATDRRCNQVAGSIVFPAAMAKVCCKFKISKYVNFIIRDVTLFITRLYEISKWDLNAEQCWLSMVTETQFT